MVTHPSTKRVRYKVTLLIRPTMLPLRHATTDMCMRVYHCAQLSYTTQHSAVLIIFPLILQTIIIAQMLPTGGREPDF